MNPDKWNELPPDLQQVVREVSRDIGRQSVFSQRFWTENTTVFYGLSGMELIVPEKAEVDKARALVLEATIDTYLEAAGPYGPEILAIASEYGSGAK